jgi:hypothetical protein
LVPIFPDRLESATAQDCGYFGGRAFVADLELTGGELIFPSWYPARRCDRARAMKMFAALPGIPPGSVWLPALIIVTPINASESRARRARACSARCQAAEK